MPSVRTIVVVMAGVTALVAGSPVAAAQSTGTESAQELANQANNPAAPLTLFGFRNILLPDVEGTSGATNVFQIQPVLPAGPFRSMPLLQLIKATIPVLVTLPSPDAHRGFGDLDLFDLFSIRQSWGRWGFGPTLTFPTASDDALGEGKYQAGPAAAFIYTGVANLAAGAIFQNTMSYAGDPSRADVNELIITPTLTLNLEKGWFIGLSDFDWTFDWENDGTATIPVGVQFGRVLHVGRQPISLSIEAGGAIASPADQPKPGWILGFEFVPIFRFQLGRGETPRPRGR